MQTKNIVTAALHTGAYFLEVVKYKQKMLKMMTS